MKEIILLAGAVVLAGCSRDHTKPVAALTSVPITGAFGWTLGDKLPSQFSLEQEHYHEDSDPRTAPFASVDVACLQDRTVYSVAGTTDSSHRWEVKASLEDKYGFGGYSYDNNGETYLWQNGDCQIMFQTFKDIVIVTYFNASLENRHIDEMGHSLKTPN
jgi:hypothetical protein